MLLVTRFWWEAKLHKFRSLGIRLGLVKWKNEICQVLFMKFTSLLWPSSLYKRKEVPWLKICCICPCSLEKDLAGFSVQPESYLYTYQWEPHQQEESKLIAQCCSYWGDKLPPGQLHKYDKFMLESGVRKWNLSENSMLVSTKRNCIMQSSWKWLEHQHCSNTGIHFIRPNSNHKT